MFKNYSKQIAKILIEKNMTISVAESCTGGLISSMLTDVSGSSAFILSNFVTYSNEAKSKYLSVSPESLNEFGAVSEIVAKEMAEGLLKQSGTDFAMSITGIAGPTGGTKEKPVGLSYVGCAYKSKVLVEKIQLCSKIPRCLMKYLFAKKALKYMYSFIKENIGE